MSEEKLSPEVAEQEFERMAELWDLDTDTDTMSEDDADSFEKAKRPLIRGFQSGRVRCDDDGVVTFDLKFSKKLIEKHTVTSISLDPEKADVLSMDKYKEKQNLHKLRAYMVSMSGTGAGIIAKIDPRDEKLIRGAVLLFLGS